MASEAQIIANRSKAQMIVSSFLFGQEARVIGGPGFRIKCGMTALKARRESILCKTKPICLAIKLMQPSLSQRIVKMNNAGDFRKTNPISRQKTENRRQKTENKRQKLALSEVEGTEACPPSVWRDRGQTTVPLGMAPDRDPLWDYTKDGGQNDEGGWKRDEKRQRVVEDRNSEC